MAGGIYSIFHVDVVHTRRAIACCLMRRHPSICKFYRPIFRRDAPYRLTPHNIAL
ncbi:hypothetical protein [Microcoleus sp. B4-C2]|uniref:hypothetical protein n=1 Tax=Microcoleus sp. B4-C2 TaxID=2818661 RepID=UPI002FD0AFC9